MISIIGLIIILCGWIAQLVVMRTDRKINPVFIILYILGTFMIAYEDYYRGWSDLAIFNILVLLVAVAVFVISISKEKKVGKK